MTENGDKASQGHRGEAGRAEQSRQVIRTHWGVVAGPKPGYMYICIAVLLYCIKAAPGPTCGLSGCETLGRLRLRVSYCKHCLDGSNSLEAMVKAALRCEISGYNAESWLQFNSKAAVRPSVHVRRPRDGSKHWILCRLFKSTSCS